MKEEIDKGNFAPDKKQAVEEVKIDFDIKNKYEFPDFAQTTIETTPTIFIPPKVKSKKIQGDENLWEKRANPYAYKASEGPDVNIKKKIEEDFPTLSGQIRNKAERKNP